MVRAARTYRHGFQECVRHVSSDRTASLGYQGRHLLCESSPENTHPIPEHHAYTSGEWYYGQHHTNELCNPVNTQICQNFIWFYENPENPYPR